MTPAIEWLCHRPLLARTLIIAAVYDAFWFEGGAFLFERM